MLRQNLLLALRTLRRQRTFSMINLAGLSLALLAAVFIGDYIYHEFRYDRHHSQAERIFRISMHTSNGSGFDSHWARLTTDYVNQLPTLYSEVEELVRFQNYHPRTIRVGEAVFKEEHAYSTDAAAFSVFDFPLVEGLPGQALTEPYSIVLTEATAKKYFGTTQAMGRTVEIMEGRGDFETYTVTGVMQNPPNTTHLPITLLTSFATPEQRSGWAYTYILLRDAADRDLAQQHLSDLIGANEGNPELLQLPLQPITDIHLHSQLAREIVPGGNAWTLPLFGAVALFILLLALINYTNLSTAQSLSRAREIGVRKVMGSSRGSLVRYFLGQSLVMALLGGVVAALLVPLIAPYYARLTGFSYSLPLTYLVMGLALMSLLVGLGAGLYPAFRLSNFQPVAVLKGQKLNPSRNRKYSLRHLLVGMQFAISLSLIVCAVVAYQQNRYLLQKDLGMQPDQVIALQHLNEEVNMGYLAYRNALLQNPAIQQVSAVMEVPSREIRDAGTIYAEGKHTDPETAPIMDIQIIDHGYLELMGMELLAGSDFPASSYRSEGTKSLSGLPELQAIINASPQHYIINETALHMAGWETPEEAIGKLFAWDNGGLSFPQGPIAGVVKDFHQEGLRNAVEPVVMVYEPHLFNHILLKTSPTQAGAALQAAQTTWQSMFPNQPIDPVFLDDLFAALYSNEQQQMMLISVFSGIALFIACLGLLGLIAYSLRMRAVELALRRILGAEARSLLWLLGKEYALLLGISTLVAIPVATYALQQWLQSFPYRINLGPWPYLLAVGLLVLAFGGNVLWQTFRHLRINPANTLRNE